MKIEFITEPDAGGMGRIIVNDHRYYGFPVELVKYFKELHEAAEKKVTLDNKSDL